MTCYTEKDIGCIYISPCFIIMNDLYYNYTAPGTSTSPLKQLNWKINPQHMKHARRAGGSVWKGVPRFNVPQARFRELFGIKSAAKKVIRGF